jgi:hypothetical protein
VTHTFFLRWCWFAAASACGLAGLGVAGFASGVHGAPLAALAVILAVTGAVSAYAGRLYWRADQILATGTTTGMRRTNAAKLLHDAEHVFQAVAVCQILGLIGAMLGYREITSAAALPNASDAVHQLTLGLGNGLTATLAGVICSLLLWAQHHALTHTLEKG